MRSESEMNIIRNMPDFDFSTESQKRKPLMKEERAFLVTRHSAFKKHYVGDECVVTWECDGDALARAIERAHGIGGEE